MMQPGSFGSAFVFAVLPFVVLLSAIYWLDRYEKEPVRLIAVALLFGAVLAPLVAVLLQSAADVPTSMAASTFVSRSRLSVGGPLYEELARGAAILLVFLLVRFEVDDLLDGLIYGALVGVGFGLAANFIAILTTHPLTAGPDFSASLFATMVSGLNHVFYGALIGLVIAAARRSSTAGAAVAAAVGTGIALGFHLLHDYLPWWLSTGAGAATGSRFAGWIAAIPNLFGLVALTVISAWTLHRQHGVVAEELSPEVDGAVTAEEYAIVTNPLKRWSTMTRAMFTGGHDWHLRKRLYELEAEFAFRKRHDRVDKTSPRHLMSEAEYRAQIVDIRKRLDAHVKRAAAGSAARAGR